MSVHLSRLKKDVLSLRKQELLSNLIVISVGFFAGIPFSNIPLIRI